MSKLRATGTRCLIEKMEASTTTASGIVLQSVQEAPKARILSVGPDVKEAVAVGNIIVVDWSKVGVFNFENAKQYVVDASTILAVLE
jgi:co-chaperonin GroES (HSP10)